MRDHYEALPPQTANHVPLSPLSFLERTAALFPDRLAVVYNERHYTWSNVLERVRRIASSLKQRGIGPGDTVSVMAANTPELFELHYAVPLTGAVLNTINTRLEPETVAYILEHSDAKLVIADTAFSGVISQAFDINGKPLPVINIADPDGPGGNLIGDEVFEGLVSSGDPDFPWQGPADEWQALALNYTSGTSGRPKGVVYHHRGAYLMAMGTPIAWELPRHPVYLYSVPMFHCNGWCHAWTMTLMAGTIICIRQVTGAAVFDLIAKHQVTHLGGAPIVLSMLVNTPEADRTSSPGKVKIMTAGAPPPAAVLAATKALGFEVMQVYGLTETYGHVAQCLWREEWDDLSADEQAELQSWQGVGFPMTESVDVIDRESGEPVPWDGETQGEIVIRGNTVMKGYYKNREATDEAFSGGHFQSGDAAVRHENGYVQIRDRLKDVIISGGENISSVEVEGVLHRHPDVVLAAVVALPDEKWGEVPCAFVELKEGSQETEDSLIAFCRQNMAGFKRPKKIVFTELPKTATGKIQKFVLRQEARTLSSETA
ncbi:acyl-CoA synthetase [Roseibium alexandrii]|uniref:3-methylmercaptopropionyl-CoA ligase n=1 Tax=Roseibium alexandrii (strain DSM 17067 / NCIMB 14079 / DFL-11) TaxID=244592 RepID=A0A5E8H3Y4_ROSAD|nr:acyl-CoA synthetase [Roseibium alexandrii]EEE46034.1 Acyl-CoA synthetase (AMP-forming)/AMP-acid ligase II [Roseibium alexandrii DFL-11]